MKKCIIKPVNYDKIPVVTLGKDENTALFQDHLMKTVRKYSSADSATLEEQILLGTHFIYQLVPDRRRKLQKSALGSHIPMNF